MEDFTRSRQETRPESHQIHPGECNERHTRREPPLQESSPKKPSCFVVNVLLLDCDGVHGFGVKHIENLPLDSPATSDAPRRSENVAMMR